MREHECPKCGRPMQLVEDDPDTGIVGGWDCECGHTELADYDEEYDT
jgi:hypothetical protein